MDENEKKIVNFIDEIRGQTHELEIPLNISANTLIIALKRAYDLNLDENNTTECYMACEYPTALASLRLNVRGAFSISLYSSAT